MNRIQFYTLTALGLLFVGLVAIHFVSAHRLNYAQSQMVQAQQKINQANVCTNNLKQLALRVVQVQQKTMDIGLHDFMTRQQIQVLSHNPSPSNPAGAPVSGAVNGAQAETPAPAPAPATTEAPNPLDPPTTR